MAPDPRHIVAVQRLLRDSQGLFVPKPRLPVIDELIATVLSQATSDRNSERAFAELKDAFPCWDEVISAPVAKVADAIRSGGIADQKARRIQQILTAIQAREGRIDLDRLYELDDAAIEDYLTSLPGVGPKTAACVLVFAMGRSAFPVDTHVHRIATRLGWIPAGTTAARAHQVLSHAVPAELRYDLHIALIVHGRTVCTARRPCCDACVLRGLCPYPGQIGQLQVRALHPTATLGVTGRHISKRGGSSLGGLILKSISHNRRCLRYERRTYLKRKHAHMIAATAMTGTIKYLRPTGGRRTGPLARRAGWPAAIAAAAMTVIAGTSLAAVPAAHADGGLNNTTVTAFESSGNNFTVDVGSAEYPTGLGLYPGSHPSIASTGSGYIVAFEANTTALWITGAFGTKSLGFDMWPGTSPSVTVLQNGEYEIAFQANTGTLWTTNNSGAGTDTFLTMNHDSSPSITGQNATSEYQIAYEGSNNELDLVAGGSNQDEGPSGFFMAPGTSPSIAVAYDGRWEVAFQANNGDLWFYAPDAADTKDTGLGMDPHSSPAITAVIDAPGTPGYQAAIEANSDQLWTVGSYGPGTDLFQAMRPGTSPSVTGLDIPPCNNNTSNTPTGGVDISFQGPDGHLHGDNYSGSDGRSFPYIPTGADFGPESMNATSSPSETAISQPSVICGVPVGGAAR